MSDTSQGPGWWQASDGRFYPPESHPNRVRLTQASPVTPTAPSAPSAGGPPGPGWWLASDGRFYPPESHPGSPPASPSALPVAVVAAAPGSPAGLLPGFGTPLPGIGGTAPDVAGPFPGIGGPPSGDGGIPPGSGAPSPGDATAPSTRTPWPIGEPMGFADLVSTTLKIFIRCVPVAVCGTLAVAVPGFIISVVLMSQLYRILPTYTDVNEARLFAYLVLAALFLLVASVESLVFAFCIDVAKDVHISGRASLTSAMSTAFRRFLSIVWVCFLAAMLLWVVGIVAALIGDHGTTGIIVTAVALLAFEVWFFVKIMLSVPVILYEGRRGISAMSRSVALVKGSWWRCFGYVVLMWVGMLLLLIATAMVAGGFVDPLAALHVSQAAIPGGVSVAAHTSVSIVAFIVQLLVPLLMVSLWAVLVYLLFTDLQIRKGPGGTSRRPRPATGRTGPEGVPGPGHGEGAGSIASGAAGGPPPFGGPPSPGPQPMGGSPLPAFGSGPSNRGYGPAPGAPQGPPPAR